ncbi:zinc dependent phospholipase C family protein [Planococcus koreensis]|uniref:zinc dependent phospholipase C family protein n=1 Tax=Planococcus koreensis TaxID=112331 RepID=UPI0039FCDDF2
MGSRIMHLIIADQVMKRLAIENRQAFLLGGISPDAAFSRERKTALHFLEGSLDNGTRFVNYKRFIDAYHPVAQSNNVLGYLTHLISDDVWLEHIYFKNDFKSRLAEDPGFLERWHDDFRLLNGKLIERFNCIELKNELIAASLSANIIAEINSDDLRRFKEETIHDFTYSQASLKQNLQVYSFSQILADIDLAVSRSVEVISENIGGYPLK